MGGGEGTRSDWPVSGLQPIDSAHPGETFFGERVSDLLARLASGQWQSRTDLFQPDLCLDWPQLTSLFSPLFADPEPSITDGSFVDCLGPLLLSTEHAHRRVGGAASVVGVLGPNLAWTGRWSQYLLDSARILDDPALEESVAVVLSLLLITSGLEQSLGNLLLLHSPSVPPLLRDLLASDALQSLVGGHTVCLLRLLVGTPLSLNARNLAWHGFVNAHAHYTPTLRRVCLLLLSLMASVGGRLRGEASLATPIPHRPLLDLGHFVDGPFSALFPALSPECGECARQVVRASPLVHRTLRPLWETAMGLYWSGGQRHFYCLCLLMPLLEASLRYLYCRLNRLERRLVSATSRQYYVTLATVLAPRVTYCADSRTGRGQDQQAEPNRVLLFLPPTLAAVLADLLLLPGGVRLRDRVSHGQVDLCRTHPLVANHAVAVSLALLLSATAHPCAHCPLLPSTRPPQPYRSLYHPVDRLVTSALRLLHDLATLADLPQVECKVDLAHTASLFHSLHFDLTGQSTEQCLPLVAILQSTLSHYSALLANLAHFRSSRAAQAARGELRSRQRTNLASLHARLPLFAARLTCPAMWHSLYALCTLLPRHTPSLTAHFRHALSLAENLAQQSQATRNNWHNVDCLLGQTQLFYEQLHSRIQPLHPSALTEPLCEKQKK